jgi:hypothetical protein
MEWHAMSSHLVLSFVQSRPRLAKVVSCSNIAHSQAITRTVRDASHELVLL